MGVSFHQPMRPAEIELVELANRNESAIAQETSAREQADTTLINNLNDEITNRTNADNGLQTSVNKINDKFPIATTNIADDAVNSDKILDGSINTTDLNESIQAQLSFLVLIPALEFGTSNSFNVSGNGYTDVSVTFTAKTAEPIVLCSLQNASGNLAYVLTGITNQQFTARVYNLSSTDVSGITLNWLTISGR